MVQILEILKIEFKIWKVCDDVLKASGCDFKPDYTQGDIIFISAVIYVVHGNSLAYMSVSVRQFRACPFPFGLGSGKYTFDMAIDLPQVVHRSSEDTFKPFVIASYDKELAIFNYMGKVVVRGISHIRKIYRKDTIVPGSINHLTECGVLVSFSTWLDYEVCEPPVKDGVKSVDMDLIESPGGLTVRLKKVSGSSGFRKISTADPSQAMN